MWREICCDQHTVSSSDQVGFCFYLTFPASHMWTQSLLNCILLRLGLCTKLYPLNPKATSVDELYGSFDPETRDWTDGIFSKLFREINQSTDKKERR